MENLEKKNKKLQKEKDTLLNSINSLKKIIEGLTNKDKYLKDLISKRELLIKQSNKKELKAVKDLDKVNKNIEVKQQEINSLNANSQKLSKDIVNLNWKILELQKTYNENQKSCDKQVEFINNKIVKAKKYADNDLNKFKDDKQKIKILIQQTIDNLNRKVKILEDKETIAKDKNDNLEELVALLKNETSELENNKREINEDINSLEKRFKELNNALDITSDNIIKKNEELLTLEDKTAKAQKELDKVLTKTAFIVRKEDHLVGFEAYIEEVSKRLGLSYQKFQ